MIQTQKEWNPPPPVPVSEHLVRVIYDKTGSLKIYPPTLVVRNGDTVYFKLYGSDAAAFFPKDILKDPQGNTVNTFKINAKDAWEMHRYVVQGTGDRVYPYAVYSSNANDFVEGNSPPEMIIEDEPPVG